MIARSVQGVEFVCANTDAQALIRTQRQPHHPAGAKRLGRWQQARQRPARRPRPVEDIRAGY